LNFDYDIADRTYLLEMPSRAVLRQFDQAPACLGPRAKRWLMGSRPTADQPGTLTLFDQERQERLIRFLPDLGGSTWSGKPQFSPDGSHLVWGNPSGAVTVVDLRSSGDTLPNIMIKAERNGFDNLRVPRASGTSLESVAM
jgi:hypothetical protein